MITITNAGILELNNALKKITNLGDAKFMYFVAKNLSILKPIVESLEETQKNITNIIQGFSTKRDELIIKFGEDVPEGKKILPTSENWEVYIKEIEELTQQYQEDINKYNDQIKLFVESVLSEEQNLNIRQLSLQDCPEGDYKDTMPILVEHNLIVE